MIPLEDALEKILNTVPVLGFENKPILSALGQVLAEDVVAQFDIPPHDNSAMDGFAVRACDTYSAAQQSPIYLKVIGEVAAGHTTSIRIKAGATVRIMTGAPLPAGADAVVRFENTDETERKKQNKPLDIIGILEPATAQLNVRLKGEDIRAGQIVLTKGTLLLPAGIGILASLGNENATVIRRPVVSVLSTGDELCPAGKPLASGQIYDSNSYTIAANIARYGGIARIIGIGRDTLASLQEKIRLGLDSDMLITSGGVSKGDYDIVKDVLAQMGNISFWTVRMKPGKPIAFGTLKGANGREIPHLGLPGNPVSSMITFEQFARPAILKMRGISRHIRPVISAAIDQEIINDDARRIFVRVHVSRTEDGWKASVTGPQGSGILTSMTGANGLAIVPEDWPLARPGDILKVQLLDDTEEAL
ncbi:MAG: molybdopterin molybdotransferase MoeA [Dehalococcoidia bacterium]|nr:molybdopterin molybdotransferase MoeA [Dehalococcoidia bacterium]